MTSIERSWRPSWYPLAAVIALSGITGCAHLPADEGFDAIRGAVSERIEKEVATPTRREGRDTIDARVRALLEGEMDADRVVQVTLLNNRALQASFADMGVARADLMQAGLLDNPRVSGAVEVGQGGGEADVEVHATQNLLQLLMRPGKTALAGARLEEARLRVAAEVLDFAAGARSDSYVLQAALQTESVLKSIAAAAEASFGLAQRLHEAGNINDLELAARQDQHERVRIELARAEGEVLEARERLNVWMGLWGQDVRWLIAGRLPDLPEEDPPAERLESLAVARRLDLQAAGKAVEASARALGLDRNWRWLTGLDAGVSADHQQERGGWAVGPAVEVEVPLFDRRQADIARRQAELRRDENLLAALAVEIRSEVRASRDRMRLSRDLAERYRMVVVPLRERIVSLTQEHYNYMLVGAFDLLLARQSEIEGYRDYVEAVRDYWVARTDLERAVGGRLPVDPSEGP